MTLGKGVAVTGGDEGALRRRVGNRLLVVLAATLGVQVAAWALLGDTVTAGSAIVAAYTALLLLAGVWLPMPREGFTWRGWLRRRDDAGPMDRLFWTVVVGNVLAMQLANAWLREQRFGDGPTAAIVLSPLLLMFLLLELRRRARRNRYLRAHDEATTSNHEA